MMIDNVEAGKADIGHPAAAPQRERSPAAVPISYHFTEDGFYLVTSPTSLHGRLMSQPGRRRPSSRPAMDEALSSGE
jgi:hypothetical protein